MRRVPYCFFAVVFLSTNFLLSAPPQLEFEKLLNYESVRVTKITPGGITIMHKSGMAKIPFAEIPEDIRKQLGLNAEDAEAFADKEQKAKAQLIKRAKMRKLLEENELVLSGIILEITKTGVLLKEAYSTNGEKEKVTSGGRLPRTGQGRIGGNGVKRKPSTEERLKKTYYEDRFVHVECDNEKFVDGQKWEGKVYPAKKYHYSMDGIRTGDVMEGFQTSSSNFLEWKGLK